jgi:hypothetical protein
MTREETQEILRILGTSFPQFGDMVHALRHPVDTLRTYRDALQQVPFLLAKEVIIDWSSGKVTPPAAYERDQTVAKLCRECRDRQERTTRKEVAQAEVTKSREDILRERSKYQPVGGWLGKIYRQFQEQADLHKAGKLSHSDYMKYVDTVVEQQRASQDSPVNLQNGTKDAF